MFNAINPPKDQLLLDVTHILSDANQILRQEFQAYLAGQLDFLIEAKSDHSPVTQADLKVHAFLNTALANILKLPILSEEGEHHDRMTWQKFWLLDPLDGTKEFIHKRPEFTINLSLVEHSQTTFAAISVPEQHVIYIGYLNQPPLRFCTQTKRWFQYSADVAVEALVQLGVSHRQSGRQDLLFLQAIEAQHQVKLIRAGSAYKFCLMLEGEVDIYPRFHPTSEWDTSAGQCLLESIGGGIYALDGKAFVYNQRSTLLNAGFIAVTQPKYQQLAFATLDSLPEV